MHTTMSHSATYENRIACITVSQRPCIYSAQKTNTHHQFNTLYLTSANSSSPNASCWCGLVLTSWCFSVISWPSKGVSSGPCSGCTSAVMAVRLSFFLFRNFRSGESIESSFGSPVATERCYYCIDTSQQDQVLPSTTNTMMSKKCCPP